MASLSSSFHNNLQNIQKSNNFPSVPPSPSPVSAYQASLNKKIITPITPAAPFLSTMNGSSSHSTPSSAENSSSALGMHSAHTPRTGTGRVIMSHKPSSARAINETQYVTPVTQQKKIGHRSLAGFDPFSPETKSKQPISVSATQERRGTEPKPTNNLCSSDLPLTAPAKKCATPQPKKTTDAKQHRRDVQSFCTSDLRSISQEALDSDDDEKRSNSTDREDDTPTPEDIRAPPTPAKTPEIVNVEKAEKNKLPTPAKKTDFLTIRIQKKETDSPKQIEKQKSERSGLTPPRMRKLPWPKKGLRRTRSLEPKEGRSVVQKSKEDNRRSSVPNTPASERKSSMYPSIVQDLMELSFDKLLLPSLAKPSPTSFLTGKEDEVVRTCEHEAAPFQMEIPALPEFVVAARLNEFVENYRRVDQNFDLEQWVGLSRMELRQVKIPQHIPIAHSLLECSDDIFLQGYLAKGSNADDRLEMVVFEGQRQFIAVFRGTTEQQSKPAGNNKFKKKAVPLSHDNETVEVYQCFLEEYQKLEKSCFTLLDKLTEQNPFCDVVFTGHSFGATLATLAAFRYSNARPMMRVSCFPMGSPKVGFSQFRHMVNSSPNLKVMRLEFGQDGKCQLPSPGGSHVGHTLVLHGSLGHNPLKTTRPVLAYKFDTPKHKKFKTIQPDLRSYVTALEEMARLSLPWANDFVGTSGKGVVVNNEARQMV